MTTILEAPVTINQLIEWNNGCHNDLIGLSLGIAVNEIVTSVTLLEPTSEQRQALGNDVRAVLWGSAIEVIHTIGGRKVDFSMNEEDEAVVTVDDVEIARFDAANVRP